MFGLPVLCHLPSSLQVFGTSEGLHVAFMFGEVPGAQPGRADRQAFLVFETANCSVILSLIPYKPFALEAALHYGSLHCPVQRAAKGRRLSGEPVCLGLRVTYK